MEVTIIDDQGNVLKTEFISAKAGFSKIYDLTKVNGSQVTFKLSNGSEKYSFTRNLK